MSDNKDTSTGHEEGMLEYAARAVEIGGGNLGVMAPLVAELGDVAAGFIRASDKGLDMVSDLAHGDIGAAIKDGLWAAEEMAKGMVKAALDFVTPSAVTAAENMAGTSVTDKLFDGATSFVLGDEYKADQSENVAPSRGGSKGSEMVRS